MPMDSAWDTLTGGLPHSEIPGSTIARISPGLFAACHVLHRLSVPRHPPDALILRLSATPNGKDHVRCSQRLHPTRSRHRCDKLSFFEDTSSRDQAHATPPDRPLRACPAAGPGTAKLRSTRSRYGHTYSL